MTRIHFFFFCVSRAPTARHVFDLVYLCLVSDHDAMKILQITDTICMLKKSALVEIPVQILNLGLIRRKSDRSALQPQNFRMENCIDFKALSVSSNAIIARNNDSVLRRHNTITFHLSLVFCVLIAQTLEIRRVKTRRITYDMLLHASD